MADPDGHESGCADACPTGILEGGGGGGGEGGGDVSVEGEGSGSEASDTSDDGDDADEADDGDETDDDIDDWEREQKEEKYKEDQEKNRRSNNKPKTSDNDPNAEMTQAEADDASAEGRLATPTKFTVGTSPVTAAPMSAPLIRASTLAATEAAIQANLALSLESGSSSPGTATTTDGQDPSCDNAEGGEIAYVPNDGGRAAGAFACLTLGYVLEFGDTPGTGTTEASRYATAGYGSAVQYAANSGFTPTWSTINACHLIGARFGGDGENTANLTTCSRMANAWPLTGQASVAGNMLSYENKVMAGLRRNQTIIYTVIPHYIGKSVIPDYWNMEAKCIRQCGADPVDFDAQVPNLMTTRAKVAVNMGYWGITE